MMLGLVFAAFYYFLVFDQGIAQKNSIAAAQAQMVSIEQQMKDNQIKLDRAAVYKKTASEVGTTITRLLSVIPEHFGSADMMKLVSNEIKVVGSSLSSITPMKPEVSRYAKEFEELALQIDISGTFQQHMLFFSNITRINQILTIRKFDLSTVREGKGDEPPLVRLSAEIVAYRYIGDGGKK
jgi:Tfp pilus assembly protein PilO